MFTPTMNQKRVVQSTGSPNSPIAIVGDVCDGFDVNEMKPFSGPGGTILDQCLHAADLIRGTTYLTKLIKERPVKKLKNGNEFFQKKGPNIVFSAKGMEYVEQLREELNNLNCNVIVAAGPAAFAAICGLGKHSTYRGYVFLSEGLNRTIKVIPTHDPSVAMRGMYIYRHMIVADLRKAKVESSASEYVPPERNLVYDLDDCFEVLKWLDYYAEQDVVGCDIEVLNYEVSCLSFSSDPSVAISIQITDMWDIEEEMAIWRGIAKVLGNPKSEKVFQNGIFDVHFLRTRNNIVVEGPIKDTMIMHSIMFPELPKGLGFLGSIYCGSQPYWKDSVKFTNIKGDS